MRRPGPRTTQPKGRGLGFHCPMPSLSPRTPRVESCGVFTQIFDAAYSYSRRRAVASGRLAALTVTPHDLAGTRVPSRRAPDRAPELPVPVARGAPAPGGSAASCRVRRRRRADRGLSKPHELKSRATANSDRGRRRRGEATGAARRARSAPIVMTGATARPAASGTRDDPDPRGPGISYRDALRPGSTPVEPALPGT